MFVTVLAAVVLGFFLILAMKKVTPPASREQREAASGNGFEPLPGSLTIERFEWLCSRLLQELGLDIEHLTTVGRRQVELIAANPAPIIGGQYLIHAELLPTDEIIEAIQVLSLIDAVKGEGASKGVFITNGFFSDEASKAATGMPIELINGPRFRQLLERFEVVPTIV